MAHLVLPQASSTKLLARASYMVSPSMHLVDARVMSTPGGSPSTERLGYSRRRMLMLPPYVGP